MEKFAKKIHFLNNISDVISDKELIKEMSENIRRGDAYVLKKVIDTNTINDIIEYLENIGRNSIPNYQKIEYGCSNFHRINKRDERSHVKGCFHQFVFFPWNQDFFDFFELTKTAYKLKNLLSGLPENKFLGKKPEDGCTSRIAFQFYPSSQGGLNKHRDPVDYHQLSVPILIMSKKGKDFHEGGLFIEKASKEKIYLDDITEPGDVIYFNAEVPHGVDKIDPQKTYKWTDFNGRWMLLLAINKLFDNESIADAQELE